MGAWEGSVVVTLEEGTEVVVPVKAKVEIMRDVSQGMPTHLVPLKVSVAIHQQYDGVGKRSATHLSIVDYLGGFRW
eukprot:9481239-Pyramimonas_sp.AAC.1